MNLKDMLFRSNACAYTSLSSFQHRKALVDAIRHGLFVLKSDKAASSTQSRMPSYGTQVKCET